ncbi:MAG: methyltransferase domain-containing protein [Burkholderiales bacterium]|nr:methyltransferase domain-containing protein [Burkholderiales bacterium]
MARWLRRSALAVIAAIAVATAQAQERFSIFVGSDPSNVERMLRLAKLRDDDKVIDLGSGDGRIVIGAALLNPKLQGIGVDIDPKLVQQATEAARAQGVAERVRFLHQNAFDADLSGVSVVFMWLWPELQAMLRPKLLAELKPGTRVVTNVWDLGSWQPDEIDADGPSISLWIVPARIDGYWQWDLPLRGGTRSYGAIFEQRFQRAEGFTRVAKRRALLREVRLRGDELHVMLDMTLDGIGFARHEFSGKVRGDAIEGSVRILLPSQADRNVEETLVLPWRARRTATSSYFAPTGLDAP